MATRPPSASTLDRSTDLGPVASALRSPRIDPADPWRAAGGFITLYFAIGVLSPYLPVYYDSLGLPLDTIGLLAALYAGAAMLGAPIWDATADWFGAARPVMAIAAAVAAMAGVALGIADGVLLIALAAVALALAMSGIMPILDARARDRCGAPQPVRGHAGLGLRVVHRRRPCHRLGD